MKNPGHMKERITLQTWTTTSRDGFNNPVGSWTTLATVWAEVRQTSSNEQEQTDTIRSETTYKIRIRQRADVTSRERISWRGKILHITAATNDSFSGETNLEATEVA